MRGVSPRGELLKFIIIAAVFEYNIRITVRKDSISGVCIDISASFILGGEERS